MKIVINVRFKKILIICIAVLVVAGAAGAYFKIFRNPDKVINPGQPVNAADKTIGINKTVAANKIINADQPVNADKTVKAANNTDTSENTNKPVVRKAQFIMLPSKRLTMGAPASIKNPKLKDKGHAATITFDSNDMKAMDNEVFYYLDLNGSRILTFKTCADPEDYKYYRCIAIETSYPNETIKPGQKNPFIDSLTRTDFGKDPSQEPGIALIYNYYCSAIAWIDQKSNTIVSGEEIKHEKLFYNCILTTLDDNGNPEGYIDENNQLHGKYYSSYEAISKAHKWKQPENFKRYFNNEIVFPHLEDFQRDPVEVKIHDSKS